jgi:hypothetical protein
MIAKHPDILIFDYIDGFPDGAYQLALLWIVKPMYQFRHIVRPLMANRLMACSTPAITAINSFGLRSLG